VCHSFNWLLGGEWICFGCDSYMFMFEIGHINMQYVLFSELCEACLGKESWLCMVGCTAWSPLQHNIALTSSHCSVSSQMRVATELQCYHLCKNEICALLGYYTASNGNPWLMFGDSVLAPSSRVKTWFLKMGLIRCPKMSVMDYHLTLHNTPEERRVHRHHGGSLKSGMC
jgi:hypothetical protein